MTALTRRDDLHNVIARVMKRPVYNSSEISDAIEQYLERLSPSPTATPTPLTEEELDAIDWLKTAHNHFKDDDNIRRCWLVSSIIDRLTNTAQENER